MLKPYWITTINDCEIGISPRPEGNENLRKELSGIILDDHLILISLLTELEIPLLGLEKERDISEALSIDFREFPIPDMSIPGADRFFDFMDELYLLTQKADRMLIHCRAGIGRSSLVALGLMVRHGEVLKDSIQLASKIRGFQVPQSQSQHKLLSYYEKKLRE